MKQLLFGIFAHPDDEAFGPSAYLHRQAKQGTDVHLILVTDGDAGQNPGYDNLTKQRLSEWHESGKRIGVAGSVALHYPDGKLCNDLYVPIATKIEAYIHTVLSNQTEPTAVELLTFEPRGITGHLDHIAVSYITTFVYERLKQHPPQHTHINRLLYYGVPKAVIPESSTDWIYHPAGLDEQEVHFTHSHHDIVATKVHIMQAHESQKADMETIISRLDIETTIQPGHHTTDHFMIRE